MMSEIFGESDYLQTVGDKPFDRPEEGGSLSHVSAELSLIPTLQITVAEAGFHRNEIQTGEVFILTDEGGRQAVFDDQQALIRLDEPKEGQEEVGWAPEALDSPDDQKAREDEVRLAQAAQESAEFLAEHVGDTFQAPDGKQYVLLEDGTTREVI